MKEQKAKWEKSAQRYATLLAHIRGLISHTQQILSAYEKVNMEFAYQMFDGELMQVIEKTGCFEQFTREFKSIHEALQSKIGHLQEFEDQMQLIMLKDHVNYPVN